jgi:hypothetical protein
VLVNLEPARRVHRQVEGTQRQLALGADQRRVERQLGVLETVEHVFFELAGAAGLVVDQLEPAAVADDIDAVDAAVQLGAAQGFGRCPQLHFSARP